MPDPHFHTREEDLDRFRLLLKNLGNPHRQYPIIHIAGTKGKGSTAVMLASILRVSGLKVGLYTSPHLITVRERIRVDGRMVTKQQFASLINRIRSGSNGMGDPEKIAYRTVFEHLTAAAFLHFSQMGADIAVVEAGLGGRLDATVVVDPILSILTPIGLDHTDILGDTMSQIAADKAHIIKPNIPVVSAEQHNDAIIEIRKRADKINAPLTIAHNKHNGLSLPLRGYFQQNNLSTALTALKELEPMGLLDDLLCDAINPETVQRGLRNVRWLGRFQLIDDHPMIVLDGAHNDLAMRAIVEAITSSDGRYPSEWRVVLSAMRGKPLPEMLKTLSGHCVKFYLAPIRFPKGLSADELERISRNTGVDATVYRDIPTAFEAARHETITNQLVLATGSLYLVGEILRHLRGLPLPPTDGKIDSRI
ncbi:MAG: folylpolyglutamate synthase/dihydrofolate synthase family protein [Candidatus Electryoneaceae bacterium]|nr:folylpolyglutamate synthase/dihydrofolate synthase family protein [Candidatus Electryoneaceae bacterium]